MSYKTIMVHVDRSRHAAARIQLAAELARRQDAHLIGIAMTGVSRIAYGEGPELQNDPAWIPYVNQLRALATHTLADFVAAAQRLDVKSFEQRLVEDEPTGGMLRHGQFTDLIVVGQTDPDDGDASTMPDFPEQVAMNSGRPVLIVPHSWKQAEVGRQALIAWDGSLESIRAITSALPLLKAAKDVKLAVFNPRAQSHLDGDLPGNDMALYLARHGVKIEVTRRVTGSGVGDALLTFADETGSDLLVMGAYGHSRFREIMLGGVTQTILDSMTVPVLMSH